MMNVQDERLLRARDGVPLLFRWYGVEAGGARGTVVLTHGLGEHSARYGHVAAFLNRYGYEVVSFDLRGHGRSGGRRGDARCFRRFLDDMEAVLEEVARRRGEHGRPLFLFGHSMGGLAVMRFLQERRFAEMVSGAVVASPWVRLSFSPEWWKLALAGVARWVAPGYRQITGLDSTRLSRDREFAATLPDQALGHHLLSARLFYDIHLTCHSVLEEAERCELPLLLLHGEADPVTSPEATQELYERLASRDKALRLYPGMVHELHNDLNREAVLADVLGWLEAHS